MGGFGAHLGVVQQEGHSPGEQGGCGGSGGMGGFGAHLGVVQQEGHSPGEQGGCGGSGGMGAFGGTGLTWGWCRRKATAQVSRAAVEDQGVQGGSGLTWGWCSRKATAQVSRAAVEDQGYGGVWGYEGFGAHLGVVQEEGHSPGEQGGCGGSGGTGGSGLTWGWCRRKATAQVSRAAVEDQGVRGVRGSPGGGAAGRPQPR
ncbi:unnamed protein product [Lepidochelys kempii]